MTVQTPAASTVQPLSTVCPNCGDTVEQGGRGRGRVFCRTKCRELFANRAKAEGAPLLAYVLCAIETRHAKAETREADLCRVARSEMTSIARGILSRRKADGMPPAADYVETLLATGDRYMDRTRR